MFAKYSREQNKFKVNDTYLFCLRQCERAAMDIRTNLTNKSNEHSLDIWTRELVLQIRKLHESGLTKLLQLPEA
jgi:hypothetical protein